MVLGLHLLNNFKSSRRFEQLLTKKSESTKEIKSLVYLSEKFKVHVIGERVK